MKLTLEHKTFTSPAIAGSLLGDPAERGFNVVLPSDYATSDKRVDAMHCNMDKEPLLQFMSDNLVFEEPAL